MKLVLSGRVFDGTELFDDAVVVVDQDKGTIESFGQRNEIEIPQASKEISGKDLSIVPGLIDTHLHYFGATSEKEDMMQWAMTPETMAALRSVPELQRELFAGYTTVREFGSKPGIYLAKAIDEGVIVGPRIISCSRAIAQTGGDDDPASLPLDSRSKPSDLFLLL